MLPYVLSCGSPKLNNSRAQELSRTDGVTINYEPPLCWRAHTTVVKAGFGSEEEVETYRRRVRGLGGRGGVSGPSHESDRTNNCTTREKEGGVSVEVMLALNAKKRGKTTEPPPGRGGPHLPKQDLGLHSHVGVKLRVIRLRRVSGP